VSKYEDGETTLSAHVCVKCSTVYVCVDCSTVDVCVDCSTVDVCVDCSTVGLREREGGRFFGLVIISYNYMLL
jgi:hypothetical protein